MQIKTTLAMFALALSVAGCTQSQQPQAEPEPGSAPGGTREIRQSGPTNAYFGLGVDRTAGGELMVNAVQEGSPVAEAGLAVGDVLLTVDGNAVTGIPVFPGAAPGRQYTVRVRRGGEEKEFTVVAAPPQAAPTP